MDHDFASLGWIELLESAQKLAHTPLGKLKIADLAQPRAWAENLDQAQVFQQETQEILEYLPKAQLWSCLIDLLDISPFLLRLQKGAVLELPELMEIKRCLEAILVWKQEDHLAQKDDLCDHGLDPNHLFQAALLQLPSVKVPHKLLAALLTPQGELNENFTPRLFQLHADLRSSKKEVTFLLDSLVKKYSQKGILQDQITDERNGRYVLLVKVSSQSEMDGILHESSASGQTVFIEPQEITPLNNRLRQKQNELAQEIHEILQTVSKQLVPFCDEIRQAMKIIGHWDSVQAKARLATSYLGKAIRVTLERKFFIPATAHPLLWQTLPPEKIIRNNLDFGEPSLAILITGPNTGGKTVLLKTLGLAGICARTGFFIPASESPIIPFFDSFFIDLGDSQSIESHISSFSGHVLKFKFILENFSDQSLILLDELNSATDPEEGAAFGRAILEKMIKKKAMIVTTTHDPKLKALALSNPQIMNASMAFHEEHKLPTYQLLVGVPGRSRALETAERLGIPIGIIELAKSYLTQEHRVFESLLAQLENDSHQAALMKNDAQAFLAEAEALKNHWLKKTQESFAELIDKAKQKMRKLFEQSQEEIRAAVQNLDTLRSRKEIDQRRALLSKTFVQVQEKIEEVLSSEIGEVPRAPEGEQKAFEVGQTVRIRKWKTSGKVLEVSANKIKVAMGSLQATFSPEDLEIVAAKKGP